MRSLNQDKLLRLHTGRPSLDRPDPVARSDQMSVSSCTPAHHQKCAGPQISWIAVADARPGAAMAGANRIIFSIVMIAAFLFDTQNKKADINNWTPRTFFP